MHRAATWLATWFGVGYTPWGPGTAGSFAALALAFPAPNLIPWLACCGILPAIWAAHAHAKTIDGKDPQEVVVDEVVGQWIALCGATHLTTITPWLIAFGLFRLFDIWKPFPVRRLEKLPGGVGIVMDDVMAGIYAALVMWLLGWNNLY